MRRALDGLYGLALWLAALCILLIATLVGLQVIARIYDAILQAMGQPRSGLVILSLPEFAGYLLAGASFLALAATLKSGTHIRVTLFLNLMGPGLRRVVETAALAFGAFATGYGTWHLFRYAYQSWQFGELSTGLIPVPLVYPQSAMVVGALLLTIAFVDELVICLRTGRPSFRAAEDAVSLGKEA